MKTVESSRGRGFTLIELLVVISIIVILLAVLVPSLSKAISAAERAACLAHQTGVAKSCQMYAISGVRSLPVTQIGPYDPGLGVPPPPPPPDVAQIIGGLLPGVLPPLPVAPPLPPPPTAISGNPFQYSMDVKSSNHTTIPLGIGLLVTEQLLPGTQLGDMVHCPSFDTSSTTGAADFGMDTVHESGVGASYYDDPAHASRRKVSSYNYRGVSYAFVHGGSPLKTNSLRSNFVLYSDMLDTAYGIRFHHQTGYNRAFGDGSGAFYQDEGFRIDRYQEDQMYPAINGISAADKDETIFEFFLAR